MGRLPLKFAGRDISFRVPYVMPGELTVPESRNGVVYPEATFLHNVDKPFEIHRAIVRLTAFGFTTRDDVVVDLGMLETQPDTLDRRVRLRITDFSKNENLTKSATLVALLLALNTGAWDWEEPYTLVRSEGFQVQIDTQELPSLCELDEDCLPERVKVDRVRVEVSFEGYLIVVAPPSETR